MLPGRAEAIDPTSITSSMAQARSYDDELISEVPVGTRDSTSTQYSRPMQTTQPGPPKLHDLPNEILSRIVHYLDTKCPSEVNWNQRPDLNLTRSSTPYLKTLSRTSKQFRYLVLPLLFTHTRLDPNQSTAFLAFINHHALTTHTTCLVAVLTGPCTHLHPSWWSVLLSSLSLTTFAILCPPYVLAEFTEISLVDTDSWVFNMPYHAIRFHQPTPSPNVFDPTTLKTESSIFTIKPWTQVSINESSSLKAYSQYEYFLRRTPSLLSSLQSFGNPNIPFASLLSNLKHFSYTAIFPFYNHVDTVLRLVRRMSKLTHLTMKLCPEPTFTTRPNPETTTTITASVPFYEDVIESEMRLALNHIDINDAWMEFDTAYTLVAHTVIFLTLSGHLQEFTTDDVKMEGIRANLEEVLSRRLNEWWTYGGEGVWRRKQRAATTATATTAAVE